MLDQFFDDTSPRSVSLEIRRRIALSVAAYAYEFSDNPIISDDEYDELSKLINPNMSTSYGERDNSVIDAYFSRHFTEYSGQWIHRHPDIDGIKHIYERHYEGKRNSFAKLLKDER
jgi:hypothetical protein